MISIEVNGKKYIGFKNCSVEIDMETACRVFNFTSTSEGKLYSPIKVDDAVSIWIDKIKILTGYVDTVTPNWDEGSHDISITGRSITSDIIDSTVSGNIDFNGPISLKTIFSKVLTSLGLTNIKVILNDKLKSFQDAELAGKQDNTVGEVVSASVAENAFDFLEKFCRKRQVFFTSDGDGNIVLSRASDTKLPIMLIHKLDGINNNVKNAGCVFDNSKRFYKYVVHSQKNSVNLNDSIDVIDSGYETQIGTAYDYGVRKSRILEIQAEVSSDIQTASDRAKWEANIRRARSFTYHCTISKFYIDYEEKQIWDINKLISVVDDYEDIIATLLIKKVTFNLSDDGSETTDLELVVKDAMTLQASENAQITSLEKKGKAVTANVSSNRGI